MISISRFTKCFELDDAVALYHSLRMKPVYLTKSQYQELLAFLNDKHPISLNEFPANLSAVVQQLAKYKIITQNEFEDNDVLTFVRSRIPTPSVNVCYFILSEQCNLACKYCFLGNNNPERREKFSSSRMTKETAEQTLNFFVRQIKLSGKDITDNKPTIIFYGGEPLLNFSVLEYVALRVKELSLQEPILRHVDLSVITNGLLLNEYRLKRLKELGVSIAISIDGCSEEANAQRIDIAGRPTYSKVVDILDLAKKLDVAISLSVTLTEETIRDKEKILKLISDYNIKGFGFNILMSDESFIVSDKYNNEASDFIIDIFHDLRGLGVYEDRMMRKLKSFSKSQVYFSDCAATAGSQIVVTPDGQVGICHGCIAERQYFNASIKDDSFNANKDPLFIEWSQLTPVNREECLSCEALGICGGGCPINASHCKKGNTIHSLDERFCTHAKKTLKFLIEDLYRIIKKSA
ncbi:FibroRumin system radical SAM peptide maturase [Proteus mirabilis]|uniref:FibroRumin system radical SAM peptide maturase n=1 Tax=Proteus mirabilis TaxID=584 RepID=UPI000D821A80|nr:FibroRumin system radical SAM peptide maturase [Proteus mirabilis]EKW4663654.1 FibroRumin system radical SAM peptide maturase [Proteus mirabilis]ELB1687575.1 FibroRumin system radical SAM peptide maturase [Proteus mirabilis]EMC9358603.1 FibroRumin system radical SAM peptide maturase [Proteus mirabilis]EMD6179261.1 FibroRumin system radical SAM peptide maturase [Proteus mirabilis]MBI6346393.1 FibroRumin system radical SAM peptide maturase [Proteus mirabilis]